MNYTKYNAQTTDPLGELHDVVDEHDIVIGTAKRLDFLQNKELIRRSAHIWLRHSGGGYWFQQRSQNKDLQPLHWSCSAAGFVRAGARTREEVQANARRELHEELGIDTSIRLDHVFLHHGSTTGGIMIYLYVGQHDGPFTFNREEVADMKVFDIQQAWDLVQRGEMPVTEPTLPELRYMLKK